MPNPRILNNKDSATTTNVQEVVQPLARNDGGKNTEVYREYQKICKKLEEGGIQVTELRVDYLASTELIDGAFKRIKRDRTYGIDGIVYDFEEPKKLSVSIEPSGEFPDKPSGEINFKIERVHVYVEKGTESNIVEIKFNLKQYYLLLPVGFDFAKMTATALDELGYQVGPLLK